MTKTNAMRILENAGIHFEVLNYTVDESDLSGVHIATDLGLPFEMVYKTLVAKGDKTGYVVFCIPVDREIDLKKAAQLSGNKRVEMIHVKELLPLTGYIRGGCSPVGMKKKFPTFVQQDIVGGEWMTVSAGIRGQMLKLSPKDLIGFTDASVGDVCFPKGG